MRVLTKRPIPHPYDRCHVRRLTIELKLDEMSRLEDNPMLKKVKSLEILQFLREGPEEVAVIVRIEFNDKTSRIEDCVDDKVVNLQLLDNEKEGTYTYFMRSKPVAQPGAQLGPLAGGGYLTVPFEIKDGRVRMSYLGSGKQVKSFLEAVEKVGIRYRVTCIADAKFPEDSPLSRLTDKQRKVLVTAFRLGYYDEPRRISSQELGEKLKISSSTLVEHRRRAERALIAELIGA